MKSLCFLIVTIIGCLTLSLFQPKDAYASMNATSRYDVQVTVNQDAQATLKYKIYLTNKNSQFFIRDYSMILSQKDISNLSIKENGTSVYTKKETRNGYVKLKISLRNPLLVQGQSTTLFISYTTKELVKKEGFLWTVHIPSLTTEEHLKKLKFTVVIPNSYGKVAYISRGSVESSQKKGKKVFSYIRADPNREDLFMFGEKQQFEYSYVYQLDNEAKDKTTYKITLPPDENYQKVYFLHADPLPDATFSDNEGNTIAEYSLNPSESKSVRISGFSTFTIFDTLSSVDSDDYEQYLTETRVWNYSNHEIQSVLTNMSVYSTSAYDKSLSVYRYLMQNYSLSSVIGKRKKVSSYIETKKDLSCLELSDSFVALSRAIGVPSRLVVGYSPLLSEYQLLHFWSEFYYKEEARWIIVDPCMTKTLMYKGFDTFDINRFVLAYWGLSDQYPEIIIPFMPYQDTISENLSLKASAFDFSLEEKDIEVEMDAGIIDPLSNSVPISLQVYNTSQRIFHFDEIIFDGKKIYLEQFQQGSLYQEAVFPLEKKNIQVIVDQLSDNPVERVENYSMSIRASYGEKQFTKEEVFTLSRPVRISTFTSWVIAALVAFIAMFIAFFVRRKVRSGILSSGSYYLRYYMRRIGSSFVKS